LRAAAFLLFTGVLHENEIVIPAVVALTLSASTLSPMAATNLDPLNALNALNALNESAPAAAADRMRTHMRTRMMTISPDTRYVNVQGGKIVNVAHNVGRPGRAAESLHAPDV
jgi:hypothetical protein